MINIDDSINQNKTEHKIPDHSYIVFITGGSGSLKTKSLIYLINHRSSNEYSTIDKIYLYAKDPFQPKYQILINKCMQRCS